MYKHTKKITPPFSQLFLRKLGQLDMIVATLPEAAEPGVARSRYWRLWCCLVTRESPIERFHTPTSRRHPNTITWEWSNGTTHQLVAAQTKGVRGCSLKKKISFQTYTSADTFTQKCQKLRLRFWALGCPTRSEGNVDHQIPRQTTGIILLQEVSKGVRIQFQSSRYIRLSFY